jgi:hypothetical protein
MGLVIKNIGGVRKGVEDMGVLGNPGKYSSVIGEAEALSPWEPLHVTAGLAKDTSAVTVFFPNCYSQILPYGSDDKGILNGLVYNLQPGRGGLTCLVLTPTQARILSKAGWTKQMIKNYVAEFARVPAYRHRAYYDDSLAYGRPGMTPMNPMDSMSIVTDPKLIEIIVAGGPGAFMGILCSSANNEWFVTKKITLPGNWAKLVAKYRNVAPAYEKY